MSGYLKGCGYVVFSAVIFGCMPLMAKNIYNSGVNAVTLVLLRNVLALPLLYAVLRVQKTDIRPKKGDAKRVAFLGIVGSAITPVLLFYSYNYISSGVATTLHFVYPVFVLLGCALFFHDKAGWVKIGCVILCSVGMLFFYTPGESAKLFGAALAVASGVTYAVYIIYLGKSGLSGQNPFKTSFGMAAACSATLFPAVLLTGRLRLPKTLLGWLMCLFFAMAVMVWAVVLFQKGTAIIGPQRASILSTFEPLTGISVGIAVFGEPFGIKTAAGSILIIAAVVLLTFFDNDSARRQRQKGEI